MRLGVGRQIVRSDLPPLIATAYITSMTIPNLQAALRKKGILPFNPSAVCEIGSVKENHERPNSRKERRGIKNMK